MNHAHDIQRRRGVLLVIDVQDVDAASQYGGRVSMFVKDLVARASRQDVEAAFAEGLVVFDGYEEGMDLDGLLDRRCIVSIITISITGILLFGSSADNADARIRQHIPQRRNPQFEPARIRRLVAAERPDDDVSYFGQDGNGIAVRGGRTFERALEAGVEGR